LELLSYFVLFSIRPPPKVFPVRLVKTAGGLVKSHVRLNTGTENP